MPSGAVHPNKSYEASDEAFAGRPRSSVRNGSPNAERSHSTLRQQIFDVAQAERETEVQPNRLLNDLGREPVTRVADFLHLLGYRAASGTAIAMLRDNAFGTIAESGNPPGLKQAVKKDGPANPSPIPSSMRDYGPSPQARPDVR
jgi:hypothetical protein